MTPLLSIVAASAGMAFIAVLGGATMFLNESVVRRWVRPLVALSAGSLLGGAFFHLLPEAVERSAGPRSAFLAAMVGFSLFLWFEQLLHWHHGHGDDGDAHAHGHAHDCDKPLTYLVLVGDGIHNLLGGIAVGSAFVLDPALGWSVFLAAAAHEIPQELGDFGVLLHAGWTRAQALAFNLLSSVTFLFGGLLAWAFSAHFDLPMLVAFAAGNFIYIGASDLVPEVKRHENFGSALLHFAWFAAGAGALWFLA